MQESIEFLLRVQCRRKESSRSLSHLLMSFLLEYLYTENSVMKAALKFLDTICVQFKLNILTMNMYLA